MLKKKISDLTKEVENASKEDSKLTEKEKRQLITKVKKISNQVQKRINIFDEWTERGALYLMVPMGIVFAFWGILFLVQDNREYILLNSYRANCLAIVGMGLGLLLLGISYFITSRSFIEKTDSFIMLAAVIAFIISFVGIGNMWINAEFWISVIIYSAVICLIQFIKIGAIALHKAVINSKDRLTIIIAVIGSIIAMVALFK